MATARVEEISVETFSAAAEALADAFADDPLFLYMATDPVQRRRWLSVVMAGNLRFVGPERQTYVAIEEGGKVVGAIGVLPPGKYPPSFFRQFRFMWEMVVRPSVFEPPLREILRGLKYQAAWDKMHFKGPHWYVSVLGVDPEGQGKGYGRLLMGKIIEQSQGDGNPIYLETQTERNVGYYRSMGFEVVECAEPAANGPKSWGMLRK